MALLRDPALTLAEQQFGVLARSQLLRWETGKRIDGLVARGSLLPLQRGVYRVVGGAVLPAQQPLAAALRCRSHATITGPFVLAHLRVDGFEDSAPYEILLPKGRRIQGLAVPTRRDPLPDRPVRLLGEVRMATPTDALIDTCRWRGAIADRRLRLAYDWLRWRGLIDVPMLARALECRAPLDPGARQLLDLLDGPAGLVPESDGERRLGALLGRFDPAPEPQVWVTDSERVDWYFAGLRLAIEYQGSVDHDTATGRVDDRRRDRRLAEAGIAVVHVRRGDLDEDDVLVQRLAGVIAVRAADLDVAAPRYRLH